MNQPDRVILFVVDGMRPDAMIQAGGPMRRLMENGAFTLTACSVMPSVTLPTHMSMFHGLTPEVHDVLTNDWKPMPGEAVPGIVDLVHQAGRRAEAYYTWEPLRDLWRPGALASSSFINIYGPDGRQSDDLMARLAADAIVRQRPDFAFIYLGLVDEVGHRHGWLSPEYQSTVAAAGAAVGHVLDRLSDAGLLENSACLLTADHGGHERAHGSDLPEDLTIPWVLAGPGIRRGWQISSEVRIYDTAPTIAHLLGLPLPSSWQGRPILEAMET